ncbi:MAG: TonB-dependent receptor, partial [Melioribacteraceae bacterium]
SEYNFDINNNLNVEFYYNYKQNEFDPKTANLYIDDLNRTGSKDYPDAKEINSLLVPDTTIKVDPFHAYGGRKYYYFRTRAHKAGFKSTFNISDKLKNVSGIDYNWVVGIPVISEGKGGKPITTDQQRKKLEHDFGTAGIYTEFSYNINSDLLLTAGGRFDLNSEYENTFVPRFALIHNFDNNILKLIFSKGYLAPSITQAYFESITTFSWIRKNENLKPEKNTSVELDWIYSKENFNLSTNLFYNNLSNSIIESVTTGDSTWTYVGTDSFYVPILQSENVSDGYRYGMNLSLAKKISSNLALNFNYSLILGNDKIHNSETEINDNLISNHKINFGVQFTYGKYQVYAEAIWLGEKRIKSFHNSTPYSNLLDGEGYLNFDPVFLLNLNFRINDLFNGMSLYCNIKNALDKEYYGQTINAQWGSPMVLQDMRRINFGIEYDF